MFNLYIPRVVNSAEYQRGYEAGFRDAKNILTRKVKDLMEETKRLSTEVEFTVTN